MLGNGSIIAVAFDWLCDVENRYASVPSRMRRRRSEKLCAATHTNADLLRFQRNGMINVSPVGRNASIPERLAFEQYDKEHQIRTKFVEALREKFAHFGLT